jgi:hypothetical protein
MDDNTLALKIITSPQVPAISSMSSGRFPFSKVNTMFSNQAKGG